MLAANISPGVVTAVIVLALAFLALAVAWGAASVRESLHTLPVRRKGRR
jgi:hypothetical protein